MTDGIAEVICRLSGDGASCAPMRQRVKPTRTGLTEVTRPMLGTDMQSAIYRLHQGAQSVAADGSY
jgi:hypothetical protein